MSAASYGERGVPVQIWMDPEVKRQLDQLAEKNGRSTALEGLHAVLRHLANPPELHTPPIREEPAPPPERKRGRKPRAKQ